MSDLVEDILKDGLRSGIPLTIEQKAQLFEVRRKLLEERANMRFRLKELDAMTPKQNVVHTRGKSFLESRGYHFSSRLTATLTLCLIYLKIT